MTGTDRRRGQRQEDDFLGSAPIVGRATTHLERSVGPSCLLSLVIVLLLLLLVKRYVRLPWSAFACIVLFTWFAVLTILVRWRPDVVVDEDE